MAQTATKTLPLRTLRLKRVELVSFKISEASHLGMLQSMGLKLVRADEVLVLVSRRGDQILFVHRPKLIDTCRKDGRLARVIHSERLRLEGERWTPYMLQVYAEKVGIKLVGDLVNEYANRFDHRKLVDKLVDTIGAVGQATQTMVNDLGKARASKKAG